MLNVDAYKDYITLNNLKKEKEEELEKLKKQITDIERNLIDNLVDNNMTKLTVDNRTVYIHSQIWAKIPDKEKAIEVLIKEGYGDYIKPTYNSHQVSRLLRDLDENEQPIPTSFLGIIEPITKISLNIIKG